VKRLTVKGGDSRIGNKHQQKSKLCGEQADRADEHCDAGSDFFHEEAREEKSAQLLFSLKN